MRAIAQQVNRWEWVILLLLLPLFMFPEGARALALLVIPALWVNRKFTDGYFIPPTPYNIPILLLLGMTGVGLLLSYDSALSIPKAAGILAGVSLLYATTQFSRRYSLWIIPAVYLVIGVAMAVIGLLGSTWMPPFAFLNDARLLPPTPAGGIPGAVGGVVNPNELAGVLAWVAPLALACCIGLSRRLWQEKPIIVALLWAATAFLCFILIATVSRGGILALAVGAVVVLAFFVAPRWRLVLVVAFAIALLVAISYGRGATEQDLVGDTLGLNGRLEIWSRALLAIRDFPLTGLGLNAFRRVVHVLYPLFGVSAEIDLAHAHNHLLQAALDLGLPGLIGYLALWFIAAGLLYGAWRGLRRRAATHHPYYSLVAGLSGALAAGWVFGIFDAVALGSRPAFLWWLLLGFAAAVNYAVNFSRERLRISRRSQSAFVAVSAEQPRPSHTLSVAAESDS